MAVLMMTEQVECGVLFHCTCVPVLLFEELKKNEKKQKKQIKRKHIGDK
jgi:hypothetical protein